jgi:hypothetical protein
MFWDHWAGWLDYTWRPGMWDATVRTLRKARKIEPYLVKTASPSPVVLLYSERTGVVDSYYDPEKRVTGEQISQYFYNNMGWYHALAQSHVQTDVLYSDSVTTERLSPYGVVVLVDARALDDRFLQVLRPWVERGGTLVATSQTSLTDAWGNDRPDKGYGLTDLFGAKFVQESSGAKGITVTGADPLLGEMKPQSTVAYDPRRTYDKVQVTSGRVVAQFDTGDPAVVCNAVGQGRSILITARKIGMVYEGAMYAGETKNHFKDYLAGVRELMTQIVVSGVKAAGKEIPFAAACDKNVEVVVRTQPNRFVVHLTNYTYRSPVQGAAIQLRVPKAAEIKAFYPTDDTPAPIEKRDDVVTFTVRDFKTHEALVVEWK